MYEKINQLNTEINELETLLAQKKAELVSAKAELPLVEEMIEICESHGFEVSRKGTWLWKTGTKGKYDKQVTVNGLELNDRNDETRILLELGFKYSKNRGQFYWVEDETTRTVKPAREQANLQNEYQETLNVIRCNESRLSDFDEKFLYDMMHKEYKKLSDKQRICLIKILNKFDADAANKINQLWEV